MLKLETGYYGTFFGEKSEAQTLKNSMRVLRYVYMWSFPGYTCGEGSRYLD